jgi:hypothetical protein
MVLSIVVWGLVVEAESFLLLVDEEDVAFCVEGGGGWRRLGEESS